MANFLAIYCKNKTLDINLFKKVIQDFSMNGDRELVKVEFPNFILFVAKKFQSKIYKTDNTVSFISGHISFEGLGENPKSNTSEIFTKHIEKKGSNDIEKVEGVFAAIYYNQQTNSLILANDKFGIMPLFIYDQKQIVLLSNEYQPIAQFNRTLSYTSIAEFLTLGVTIGEKTFLKHIKNLEPANFVKIDSKQTIQYQYWKVKKQENKTVNTDELAKKMYDLFTKVNQEYIEAQVSEICLLTAGADSRLIVSTLNKKQLSNLTFYTSNLSFLSPEEDKDVVGASQLCSKFNLKHKVEKISFYENEFTPSYFDTERQDRDKHLYGGWHGGEFLGGYSRNFVPINKELSFKEIDEKFKSIFNWRFRLKTKKHPYQSYIDEKSKLSFNNNEILFQIHQMTRSFFTNIYGGTRGHWVQPFQLMNHGFSPFWDSRFLQLLIQINPSELENYNLYNKVFKFVDATFKEIPSNSPLTNRDDSEIPKLKLGIEPKHNIPNKHSLAYNKKIASIDVWKKQFYNKSKILEILKNENDSISKQWLDFEMWYSRYFKE